MSVESWDALAKSLIDVVPEMAAIILVIALFLRHITRQNVELNELADRYHSREGEVIKVVKENTAAVTRLTESVRVINLTGHSTKE